MSHDCFVNTSVVISSTEELRPYGAIALMDEVLRNETLDVGPKVGPVSMKTNTAIHGFYLRDVILDCATKPGWAAVGQPPINRL